jgi:hypothetical protein
MNVQTVLDRMSVAARATKDDARSVQLMRVADRLAHQGAFGEKPLTAAEIAVVKEFLN